MNTVINYLSQNWQRLAPSNWASPAQLSCVLATPRFRASSHVIFFVMPAHHAEPLLVAKVPRLRGDHMRLDHEANNLRLAQAARPEGFASIPRVLAYEEFHGHKLLIETALSGVPMSPAYVRRKPQACVEAGWRWVAEFHQATAHASATVPNWFEHLIAQPIRQFQSMFPPMAEELGLLTEVLALCAELREMPLPLVLSHEDLSHPNILVAAEEQARVVDWELAEPHGLPALDWFFFLNYIAFARRGARKNSEYLAAFQEAFVSTQAWAKNYLQRYAEALHVPRAALVPLFVLCWTRYLIGLITRLRNESAAPAQLEPETLQWLRSNRYYLLWRYALTHRHELQFD